MVPRAAAVPPEVVSGPLLVGLRLVVRRAGILVAAARYKAVACAGVRPPAAAVVEFVRSPVAVVSAAVVEVAPVEAVSQSVPLSARAVVEGAPLVPASSAVVPPAVSAAVSYVYVRTAEVEVVAARIARVYGEMPYSARPVKRAVKVGCRAERPVLPV